jgi:hypothetical protein
VVIASIAASVTFRHHPATARSILDIAIIAGHVGCDCIRLETRGELLGESRCRFAIMALYHPAFGDGLAGAITSSPLDRGHLPLTARGLAC